MPDRKECGIMTQDIADLGTRLRAIRKSNNWKISDVSRMTGLAISTISKVENGHMSLTYDKLMQVVKGLSIDLVDIFSNPAMSEAPARAMVTARRSVGREDNSYEIDARFYNYRYLNTDLAQKAIIPILGETTAKSIEEFGDMIRHEGEEFLYVLEGNLLVYTEFYNPVRLTVGESLYIDSTMGHAYIAVDCEKAKFLCACTKDDRSLLIEKAQSEEGDTPMGNDRAHAPAVKASRRIGNGGTRKTSGAAGPRRRSIGKG
ncbi:XRE family transcriptional regulator [Rhizorhabdus wittichii DC-6]|nr:XRE family transcriptional regulator [Rhizorhabdus wittichii DC-6]